MVQSSKHDGVADVKNVPTLNQQCPHSGVKQDYKDDSFVGGDKIAIPGVRTQSWDRLGKPEGYALYRGGIEAGDINQGQLGDCYFLAAIAALAEDPKAIEGLIIDYGHRCYGVRLYHWGRPIVVWIDDRFPVDHGKPVFSHSNGDKEMWVLLLEKAYAKMYGTYGNIAAGLPSDALNDLTGCPVTTVDTVYAWNSQIWEEMTKHTGSQGASISCASILGSPVRRMLTCGMERYFWRILRMIWMCLHRIPYVDCVLDSFYCLYSLILFGIFWLAGTIDDLCCGIFSMIHAIICTTLVGLVPGHAYSVLEVKGEGFTKLVKLRNPWGKTEWKGFYGDNSCCWSIRGGLKEELGIEKEDDGSFWMHLNDFCVYFDRVDTCLMLPQTHSLRIHGKLNMLNSCVMFHVEHEDTELCVQINQPRNGKDRSRMVHWRLRVVQSGNDVDDDECGLGDEYSSSVCYNQDCQLASGLMNLKPGKYSILIDCHPSDKKDVNRDGGVQTSIVISSKHCNHIRFDVPNLHGTNPQV